MISIIFNFLGGSIVLTLTVVVFSLIKKNKDLCVSEEKIENRNFLLEIRNRNLYYLYLLSYNKTDIMNYFAKQSIGNLAIYGMNEVGKGLAQLLVDAGVSVCYGIDKNPNIVCDFLDIYTPEKIDQRCGVIIIAVEEYFDEVVNLVGENKKVLKMSEVLSEILLMSHAYL